MVEMGRFVKPILDMRRPIRRRSIRAACMELLFARPALPGAVATRTSTTRSS